MLTELWDLFIAFTRASNLGFGGGPATIPLMKAEVVDRYQWMTDAQFADAFAIGNTLPGPIATKMSGYIGYQVAGWPGAFVSLLGVIAPTVIIVILLGNLLMKYANSPGLKSMLMGVRPVVVVLIAKVAIDMGLEAFPDIITVGIAIVSLVAIQFLKIHPAIMIISSMAFGLLVFR